MFTQEGKVIHNLRKRKKRVEIKEGFTIIEDKKETERQTDRDNAKQRCNAYTRRKHNKKEEKKVKKYLKCETTFSKLRCNT